MILGSTFAWIRLPLFDGLASIVPEGFSGPEFEISVPRTGSGRRVKTSKVELRVCEFLPVAVSAEI